MLFVRFTLKCISNIHSSHQPRSQVLSPTRRETLVESGHVSPRISVRFVSTKRRRRDQWPCLKDKTVRQNLERRILWQQKRNFLQNIWSECLSDVAKEIADSPLVQSKIFKAVVFIPKRTGLELPFLCYGGHFWKQMYVFLKLWLCSSKGAEKMYEALPSSPTSKILKSNRCNRKRIRRPDSIWLFNWKGVTESWKSIFLSMALCCIYVVV